MWHCCDAILTQRFTIGQVKKTDVTPKDILFIVLCVLKAETNWDLMGVIIEKKEPKLQRLFSIPVTILSLYLRKEFVSK